ncbi:arylesterase [Thioflexithrix psekupsensis]|uniref:Arylesterase n=2 Tax=Thioflexithrix psekupsensis TaxID=1570016 RepID=A0A251XAV1_9GAMM|nr:arylesterase [Thioflexithrix psekupsensis]
MVYFIPVGAENQTAPTILIIGDSLSAGYGMKAEESWPHLLQKKLQEQKSSYRVINDSISGNTTHNGLSRLPDSLKQYQPDIVILQLGGNDGLRGLSLKQMRDNFIQMIEKIQNQGAKLLLLGIKIPPNYGAAYTERFEAIFLELAEQYKLPFEAFFLAGVADNPELMQSDDIHPNAAAQPIMLNNIWQVLEPLLSD